MLLQALLDRQNLNRDPDETAALLDAADINNNGQLDYTEFCNAVQAATYKQARITEAQDGFRKPPKDFYVDARAALAEKDSYNHLASSTYNRAQSLMGDTTVESSLMAAAPNPPHELGPMARDRIRTKVLGSKAGLFGGFLNQAGCVHVACLCAIRNTFSLFVSCFATDQALKMLKLIEAKCRLPLLVTSGAQSARLQSQQLIMLQTKYASIVTAPLQIREEAAIAKIYLAPHAGKVRPSVSTCPTRLFCIDDVRIILLN